MVPLLRRRGLTRDVPARAARYIRRLGLQGHPFRAVGRRCYFEVSRRLTPRRLGRIHISTLQGTTYRLGAPLTEPVGRSIFLYGTYEPLATVVFASLLREGDVAVDVGAHYGDFTLAAAFAVGPLGRVYAFEPQADIRAILERNVARNALTNVKVSADALSDFEGSANLFRARDPLQTGGASLSAEQVGQQDDYIETTVRRLDSVVAGPDLHTIAAIKVDVEGEEACVLRGARCTLEQSRPAIVFEVNALYETEHSYTCAAFEVLRDLGYSLFGMVAEDGGFRLNRVPFGVDPHPYCEPWLALNLVAIAPGSVAEERLRSTGKLSLTP